ncbi:hypothetical protein Esti_002131 [Eimeria stiedai]
MKVSSSRSTCGPPPPSSAPSSCRGSPACEDSGAPRAPFPAVGRSGAPLDPPASKPRRRRPRPKGGKPKTRQVSPQGPHPLPSQEEGAPQGSSYAEGTSPCGDSRWSCWGPPEEERPLDGGPPSRHPGRPEGGEGASKGAPAGSMGRRDRQQVAVVEERRIKETQQERLERAALPPEALSSEVLRKTPKRVASALSFFTKGYRETVQGAVGDALYDSVPHQNFVAVKDLEIASVCEHHLLPFVGKCHIVYMPGRLVVGLSKLPRIIEVFERRLQMQAGCWLSLERLTAQVADGLEEALSPRGVLVMMECAHACMSTRGVGCRASKTITLVYRGEFERDPALRKEALALIR